MARADMARFSAFTADYSDDWAQRQAENLRLVLTRELAESPLKWPIFRLTGPPYRGYLFRVSRRVQFWIIYTVDEETTTVRILRFWNAAGDPRRLRV